MAWGSRWSDRIVTIAVVVLIGVPPLAFGAVHRGAFTTLEAIALVAFAAWMVKVWNEGPAPARLRITPAEFWRLARPAVALAALLVFQLIPFPARILRVIAPATTQLYRNSFPGWPAVSPYQAMAPIWMIRPGATAQDSIETRPPSGTTREAHGGGSGPARPVRVVAPPIPSGANRLHWRALSLSPSVTISGLLEWLTLAALFFLILAYPFGLVGEREGEQRFYRAVILGTLATAALVAAIGLLERAWWNGKLLWFYVPEDWRGPLIMSAPRASGPFVDPDHFANYLAMVLPVGVVASVFPLAIVDRSQRSNLQLFAGLASLMIAAGILLSFSRGGWAAAAIGVTAALILCARHAPGLAPAVLRRPRGWTAPVLVAVLAAGLGVILFVAGPVGRTEMSARLASTVAGGDDVRFRPAVWRDTLKMIVDFPLFGVGLGSWPEIFPHYQRPPWMPFFFRQAENDYLQFMAETGACGALALVWLGATIISALKRGGARLPERHWPLLAGLIGAVAASLVHEGFDFALHTPSNAFLFTILLALALRVAIADGLERAAPPIRRAPQAARSTQVGALLGGVVALGLIVAIYAQDGAAYPYGVLAEGDLRKAEANVTAHPAMSGPHLVIAELAGLRAPAEIRLAELSAAVWLDPNDPAARDLYAQALLLTGKRSDGLEQVTISVYHAPRRGAHQYLASPLIPWLLPEEQTAIKDGFERAIAAGFAGATAELAAFYGELGRYVEIAELYARAARAAVDPGERRVDLVEAGRNYGLVGDEADAVKTLRAAAAIDPTDPRPYAELARSVFGPASQLAAAGAAIQQGLRAGADPFSLYVALADAAERTRDRTAAEAALEQALRTRVAFDITMRLGNLYLEDKQFGRAVQVLRRATVIDPAAASAWFALGEAHEGVFDYFSAGLDYARARALEPASQYYASVYADFMRKTALSAAPGAGSSATRAEGDGPQSQSPVTVTPPPSASAESRQ